MMACPSCGESELGMLEHTHETEDGRDYYTPCLNCDYGLCLECEEPS